MRIVFLQPYKVTHTGNDLVLCVPNVFSTDELYASFLYTDLK